MTMIRDYMKHEQEYLAKFGEKTMFLMQCGSFYEVYCCKKNNKFCSNRIEEFSRICDMRIANKKSKHQGLSVFMSGFPELHLEKYVKKLNDAGWTVAVHSQDPTCPSIRKEMGIFSPGTNFEASETTGTNRITTIWVEVFRETKINKNPRMSCGIACVDIGSGDVHGFQCVENYFNNPTTFDELERFNSSYPANELILIHNCDEKEFNNIVEFSNIKSSLIHNIDLNNLKDWEKIITNCQKQTYQETELTKYYEINDYDIFYDKHQLREREYSTQALTFLLNFLDFHNHNLVRQLKEPTYTNLQDRVRLANHSLKQLNIIETTTTGKNSSLMSLVNKCKTPMGKRYLSERLLNPTNNEEYLNGEYSIIDYVIKSKFNREKVFDNLNKITDFERLFRKIILNRIAPSDLAILFDNLKTIKDIINVVKEDKVISNYLYFSNLSDSLKDLRKMIENSVDTKIAGTISSRDFDINIFKEGVFNDLDIAEFNFNNENKKLELIREFLDYTIDAVSSNNKNHTTVKIHETERSGLYLTTTKTRFKKLIKNLNEKIDENETTYSKNYKINNESLKLIFEYEHDPVKEGSAGGNNVRLDNKQLNSNYVRISQTKSILKEVLMSNYKNYIDKFLLHKKKFETIINFVTKLDFLLARVYIAVKNNYCMPVIDDTNEQSFFEAKNMRHPLIEKIQENEIYVPNDIELGIDNDKTGIMLFGTNAVGKSSLIRSIGMCVILAQSGFFVPCSSFKYKPYNAIFTRILGNDDIFKGLSTFAVEMSELNCILENADENSLVLGDELCSGTETTSALCIFSAGLIMLHNKNSSFIFATHFHELTDYDEITQLKRLSLQHMVVKYDERLKTLVYDRKLHSGSGNKLYGLEVCKSLSMPNEFLTIANKIRCNNIKGQSTVLDQNNTRYNAHKIRDKCELCGEKATEIHHMQPQEEADSEGFINSFHKNHKANLCSICKKCHLELTLNKTKHIRVKTEIGMKLIET